MPGFATDAEVSAYVKDNLAKAVAENLEAFWASVISAANSQAYQFILKHWLTQGYSASQIATWDFGNNFQIRCAAYFAVGRLAAIYPDSFSQQALKFLDPRMELTGDPQMKIPPASLLISGGIPLDPATTVGLVSTGLYNTDQDEFVPFCPDDPRLGQPTRF